MSFTVTLEPSKLSYSVDADTTLLQAALDAGINLPYGCRNGACGACKGRVLEGEIDHGKHQASTLTDAEKARGMALFCCARAKTDLVLEAKTVGGLKDIPVRTLPCRVQKLERVAPDVMVVGLKLPANERMQFLAGQYIDFLLRDGRRRSFSMANAPHDDELVELHIREVPGGHFTGHVFNSMKERDILRFEGPLGTFFLREDASKPIVFLAGGTGFAPIKAIIEHMIHAGIQRPAVLYWGARARQDLYMEARARQWEQQLPGFRFVPVLSEPRANDGWQGRTGLVHQAVVADMPDLSGHQVYACGAPGMIDAAKQDFTQTCKLPIEEFYADSFSFSADTVAS